MDCNPASWPVTVMLNFNIQFHISLHYLSFTIREAGNTICRKEHEGFLFWGFLWCGHVIVKDCSIRKCICFHFGQFHGNRQMLTPFLTVDMHKDTVSLIIFWDISREKTTVEHSMLTFKTCMCWVWFIAKSVGVGPFPSSVLLKVGETSWENWRKWRLEFPSQNFCIDLEDKCRVCIPGWAGCIITHGLFHIFQSNDIEM
jgi:hypothetical protein